MAYRARWRADASGFVAAFAGKDASGLWADRDELAEIVRQMPNGGQVEIVEVAIADRVVPSDAAYAVGRFNPGGTDGYRARNVPGAELRASRAEAEADWLDHVASGGALR